MGNIAHFLWYNKFVSFKKTSFGIDFNMNKTKTILKNILIIFLLLIVSVCFCACGEINSSVISQDNGTIEEVVIVKLDLDKILDLGYTTNQILKLKEEIQSDAQDQSISMKEKLNNKVALQLTIPNLEKETREVLESYYNGITIKESNWNDNQYSIKVVFKNIDVYKYYYNISDDNKVETKEEKHFFYNKLYWYGNTMYLKHRELYESLKNKYQTKYPNLINDDAKLTYTYCADLRRQHSDADYIEKVDGKYYHTWIVDKENPNQQIMFYYNVANTYNWIIISVIVTLIITIIFSIIVIIKKINKNSKNKENI